MYTFNNKKINLRDISITFLYAVGAGCGEGQGLPLVGLEGGGQEGGGLIGRGEHFTQGRRNPTKQFFKVPILQFQREKYYFFSDFFGYLIFYQLSFLSFFT